MAAEERPIRAVRLPGGLTVLHESMPWLKSVSFQLLLPVGATSDPEGQEGNAAILADWLYRGAGAQGSRALSDGLDGLGVRRGGGAGSEYLTLSGSLLAEEFEGALSLYSDIVRRPTLDDKEFEPSRRLALQELAALEDEPAQLLLLALAKRFFSSPHGRSPYGSAEGLNAAAPDQVRDDYARRATAAGSVLAVAGSVSWDTLERAAERLFGDWHGDPPSSMPVRLSEPGQGHVERDTAQTQIGIAYEAVAPGDRMWYCHALAANVLSGSMGSRLFREVREERGLAYHVAAVTRALRGFGYTIAFAGTTPERADETLDVLQEQLVKLHAGVEAAELERARTGLLSQLVMQGESTGARAAALSRDMYLLERPRSLTEVREAVEAVGLDDVNAYLDSRPEPAFTVLTLGPKPPGQRGEQ